MSEVGFCYGRSDVAADNLKKVAWKILHDNPGCSCDLWIELLLEQYAAEVKNVLGGCVAPYYDALEGWWVWHGYVDQATGLGGCFRDWAERFATAKAVEVYDLLVDAKNNMLLA